MTPFRLNKMTNTNYLIANGSRKRERKVTESKSKYPAANKLERRKGKKRKKKKRLNIEPPPSPSGDVLCIHTHTILLSKTCSRLPAVLFQSLTESVVY